jgi:nucleoside-diphosphate-sugar epimerase
VNTLPGQGASLVFGASGFIGRWVVRELLLRGNHVTAVVRDPGRGEDAFAGWSRVPELHRADLAHAGEGSAVIAALRPAVVYNLAGYGVDRTERGESLAERINHHLVAELAVACAAGPSGAGPRFVHVGSALEYGVAGGILSESTAPQPTTLYGRTKLAGTREVTAAALAHGTRGVTARLFTVFGDGEHPGRLFPSLINAAQRRSDIPLTDGRQRRDFAWAGDVAGLLVDLAGAPYESGEVVNVACGRMHSVADFARECAAQLGMPAERLRFGALPGRPEEMEHDGVDITRLRALTGRAANANLGAAIALALGTPLGS